MRTMSASLRCFAWSCWVSSAGRQLQWRSQPCAGSWGGQEPDSSIVKSGLSEGTCSIALLSPGSPALSLFFYCLFPCYSLNHPRNIITTKFSRAHSSPPQSIKSTRSACCLLSAFCARQAASSYHCLPRGGEIASRPGQVRGCLLPSAHTDAGLQPSHSPKPPSPSPSRHHRPSPLQVAFIRPFHPSILPLLHHPILEHAGLAGQTSSIPVKLMPISSSASSSTPTSGIVGLLAAELPPSQLTSPAHLNKTIPEYCRPA